MVTSSIHLHVTANKIHVDLLLKVTRYILKEAALELQENKRESGSLFSSGKQLSWANIYVVFQTPPMLFDRQKTYFKKIAVNSGLYGFRIYLVCHRTKQQIQKIHKIRRKAT